MRAELLGQLVAAQFEIEAALKEAGGNVGVAKEGVAQLQLLTALQRQIGSANPVALAAMRGEIIASVTAAQAVALQTRSAADTDSKIANLSDVTKNTRQTIQNIAHELFGQKKLDPYLQFQSAEDEAEYRKREAERKAYIERENAKGTPQGALNAINATAEQLKDAADHGADRSPDFARMYGAVTNAADTQRAAMGEKVETKSAEEKKAAVSAIQQSDALSDIDEIAAALRTAGVAVPDFKPLNSHGLKDTASVETTTLGRNG